MQLILALHIILSPKLFAAQTEQPSQITLLETSKVFHYQTPPRLSTVLTEALSTLPYSPYILGASLVDEKQIQGITVLKQSVLERLARHASLSTEKIISQLKQTNFAQKERLSLDNDTVRIFPQNNPLLNGKFQLYLPKRPKDIAVYGAIQSNIPIHLTIKNGLPLWAYLSEIPFYNVAMNTTILIIQPDQTTYRIQNINREPQPTYLAPGAIIYISSNELPNQLNNDIVKLLKNRLEI